MVTVYDVRTSKGQVSRMVTGTGQAIALSQVVITLYCLFVFTGHHKAGRSHIAAGGTDRSLFIFDVRKWSKIARMQVASSWFNRIPIVANSCHCLKGDNQV